jgi:hypothetical protein
MKTLSTSLLMVLLFCITLPAQSNTPELFEQPNVIKLKSSTEKKTKLSSKVSTKVKRLTNKKSNDLISIKAYRRSLNVKVKTLKLC